MVLKRKLRSIKKSGELFLASENDLDLTEFSKDEFYADLKLAKLFNFSRTPIKNFIGIPKLNKLKTLIADNSQVENLSNIHSMPNLTSISLKNTPVSRDPHFFLSVYIGTFRKISQINGKLIPENVKKTAAMYPDIASYLVNVGWMVTKPVPTEEEFDALCKKYGINPYTFVPQADHDVYYSNSADPQRSSGMYDPNRDISFEFNLHQNLELPDNFEDKIIKLRGLHDHMLLKSQALFGIVHQESFNYNQSFSDRISKVLKFYGFDINDRDNAEISSLVNEIVKSVIERDSYLDSRQSLSGPKHQNDAPL